MEETTAGAPGRSATGKWIVALLVTGAVLFLAGWVPGRMAAGKARDEARATMARLESMRQELAVARVRGTLGMAVFEAQRNNFGHAATYAMAFFDGLRAALGESGMAPERRAAYESILSRRDEIAGDLARADAAVQPKLTQIYVEMGIGVDPRVELSTEN